jgi:YD repeat-containing protein
VTRRVHILIDVLAFAGIVAGCGQGIRHWPERDARGLAQAIVGPYGQRTELFYDENDQLERIEDPLQRHVSFGYDEAGRLTSMRDARDSLHRYEYDERGRLTKDIGPTGYTQTLAPAQGADTPRNTEA